MTPLIFICGIAISAAVQPAPERLIALYQEAYSCNTNAHQPETEYMETDDVDLSQYFPQPPEKITFYDFEVAFEGNISVAPRPDFVILPDISAIRLPARSELRAMISSVRDGAVPVARLDLPRASEQDRQRFFWCSLSLDLCPVGWVLPMGVSDELLADLEQGLYIAPIWLNAQPWPLPPRVFELSGSIIIPNHAPLPRGGGISASVNSTEMNPTPFVSHDLLPDKLSWSKFGSEFTARRIGVNYHVTSDISARVVFGLTGLSLQIWMFNLDNIPSLAGLTTQGFAWVAFVISVANFLFFAFVLAFLVYRLFTPRSRQK